MAQHPGSEWGTPLPNTTGPVVRVNKDNVLKIAAAVQQTADELQDKILERDQRMSQVGQPAYRDPVSEQVAKVMLAKMVSNGDSYSSRAQKYVEELKKAADAARAAAKNFGYTDEQIATTFRGEGTA